MTRKKQQSSGWDTFVGAVGEAIGAETARAAQAPARIELKGLQEVVDRINELEAERDAAVARADVADYTREALADRCKELENRHNAARDYVAAWPGSTVARMVLGYLDGRRR